MLWDDRFESVLRSSLRFLDADESLDPQCYLASLGLDSMGTVELLVNLESEFGIRFPDDALVARTFESAGNLWTVVGGLLGAEERTP